MSNACLEGWDLYSFGTEHAQPRTVIGCSHRDERDRGPHRILRHLSHKRLQENVFSSIGRKEENRGVRFANQLGSVGYRGQQAILRVLGHLRVRSP